MPRGRPPKDAIVQNNATDLVDNETVEQVAKVKHKRPGKSELMKPHFNPGDNTKYLNNALAMWDWGTPDMTSVEAVEERARDYFTLCAERDMKPTVAGFAFAFGVDRRTMWAWVNGSKRDLSAEIIHSLKKSYRLLNSLMEDYMQNGKINPVSGIFLMKNNMGYADQTEIVVTPNNPIGEEVSADELQKRITDGVIVELPEDDE